MRRTKIPGWFEFDREACLICGHKGNCMLHEDKNTVACTRTKSPITFSKENPAWIHKIDIPDRFRVPIKLPKQEKPIAAIDWPAVMRDAMQAATTPRVATLADELGVSRESLRRLGVGYMEQHAAYAFPMRDCSGTIIGIRLRSSVRKWAVLGSREGLFIPSDLSGVGPLLICEGPTDCAALLDLGFAVVGRPSCRGAEQLCVSIARARRQDIIIAANYDEAKSRPDGSKFWPGQEGAIALAEKIGKPVKIIYPIKHKDFRAWITAGASRATVDLVIRNAGWFRKGVV